MVSVPHLIKQMSPLRACSASLYLQVVLPEEIFVCVFLFPNSQCPSLEYHLAAFFFRFLLLLPISWRHFSVFLALLLTPTSFLNAEKTSFLQFVSEWKNTP